MSEEGKDIVLSTERLTELANNAKKDEERYENEPTVNLSRATDDLLKRARVASPRLSNDELIRQALEAYLRKSERSAFLF